jgi:hypothetical protein
MKDTMKKLCALALLALAAAQSHASGVPTVDVAAISQAVLEYSQLLEQYKRLGEQLSTQQGIRDLAAQAVGYKGLDRSITTEMAPLFSAEAESAIAAIRTGGYAGLTARGRSVYAGMGLGARCEALAAGTRLQDACIRRAALLAQRIAAYEEARDTGVANQREIERALRGIQSSTDLKGAAEAQAAIQKLSASFAGQVERFRIYSERIAQEEKVAELSEQQAEMDYSLGWSRAFKAARQGKGGGR